MEEIESEIISTILSRLVSAFCPQLGQYLLSNDVPQFRHLAFIYIILLDECNTWDVVTYNNSVSKVQINSDLFCIVPMNV